MLKHNIKWQQAVKACCLLFTISIFIFSGCKTVPAVSDVNPVDLLDNNSSFYLRIPTDCDPDLVKHILQNNLRNLSDSDAKKIADHIDTIYLGLNKSRNAVDYQLATACSFPKIAISQAFSRKNGWNAEKLALNDASGKNVNYTVYSNSGLNVSVPSTETLVAGRSVPAMVERYHNLSNKITDESYVPLNDDIRSWLAYENDIPDQQVKLFASRPQSFLTMLTGANLNFKLDYVRGSMYTDPKMDSQYILDLEFEFKESKYLLPAKSLLTLAFGLTNSGVSVPDDTHLLIYGIRISKKQLAKILVL